VRFAQAIGYVGAAQRSSDRRRDFYFLEMNGADPSRAPGLTKRVTASISCSGNAHRRWTRRSTSAPERQEDRVSAALRRSSLYAEDPRTGPPQAGPNRQVRLHLRCGSIAESMKGDEGGRNVVRPDDAQVIATARDTATKRSTGSAGTRRGPR